MCSNSKSKSKSKSNQYPYSYSFILILILKPKVKLKDKLKLKLIFIFILKVKFKVNVKVKVKIKVEVNVKLIFILKSNAKDAKRFRWGRLRWVVVGGWVGGQGVGDCTRILQKSQRNPMSIPVEFQRNSVGMPWRWKARTSRKIMKIDRKIPKTAPARSTPEARPGLAIRAVKMVPLPLWNPKISKKMIFQFFRSFSNLWTNSGSPPPFDRGSWKGAGRSWRRCGL